MQTLDPVQPPHDLQTPSAPSTPDAVLASFRGAPHAMLDVAPHRIAYRRFGSGPDVVFIHGWPLTSATFRALIPPLAGALTCHLIDLVGSGQTESPGDRPLDLAAQADVVRATVDVLGLRRYALLSHDSGGLVARFVAARDRRVAALVSGNTEVPGHTPEIMKNLFAAAHAPGGVEALRLAMQSREVRGSAAGYGDCFADPTFIDGDFHELLVAPLLQSSAAWARQMGVLLTIDPGIHDRMRAAHAAITAPTLFVWGDGDPVFPLAKARAMLSEFPAGARLETIGGGKCFVHEERPAEFVAHALPFLRQGLTTAS